MDALGLPSSKSVADLARLQPLAPQGARPARDKMDDVAREFEAVFITEMLKPMFEGLEADPLFGGGSGEDTFRSFYLDEYGKAAARSGGFGLAEGIRSALLAAQEGAAAVTPHTLKPLRS